MSERLDPGTYTVTARAADGRRVLVNGRDSVRIAVESTVIDLDASLDGRTLTVENPGDRRVTVRVSSAAGERSFAVGAGETATRKLSPVEPVGHVVTATAPGREVLVNGLRSYTFFVPLPPTVDLGVTVDRQNVTVRNPSATTATVTTTAESGAERTISVPPGEQVTEAFDPGSYTLTGVADEAARPVRLNGQERLAVEIEEQPLEPADLGVTVGGQNVTVENPSDTAVSVTAPSTEGERTFDVPVGGEWNLTVTLTAVATPTETPTATETATDTDTETPTTTETTTPTETATPTSTQAQTPTETPAQTTEPAAETETTATETAGAAATNPLAGLFEAIEGVLA